MAKKGVLGKGTKIWMYDAVTSTLTKLDCVKSMAWGDDSIAEIDSTCLEDDVATTEDGLTTPGSGSLGIDTDPTNASHLTLLSAAQSKKQVELLVGWSDGTGDPTLTSSTLTLPTTRTWSRAIVNLRKNPVVIDPAALNNHTIPFKRQTEVTDTFKLPPSS